MVHALTWVLATFLSPLKCQEPSVLSVEGSLGLNNILSYDIAAKWKNCFNQQSEKIPPGVFHSMDPNVNFCMDSWTKMVKYLIIIF